MRFLQILATLWLCLLQTLPAISAHKMEEMEEMEETADRFAAVRNYFIDFSEFMEKSTAAVYAGNPQEIFSLSTYATFSQYPEFAAQMAQVLFLDWQKKDRPTPYFYLELAPGKLDLLSNMMETITAKAEKNADWAEFKASWYADTMDLSKRFVTFQNKKLDLAATLYSHERSHFRALQGNVTEAAAFSCLERQYHFVAGHEILDQLNHIAMVCNEGHYYVSVELECAPLSKVSDSIQQESKKWITEMRRALDSTDPSYAFSRIQFTAALKTLAEKKLIPVPARTPGISTHQAYQMPLDFYPHLKEWTKRHQTFLAKHIKQQCQVLVSPDQEVLLHNVHSVLQDRGTVLFSDYWRSHIPFDARFFNWKTRHNGPLDLSTAMVHLPSADVDISVPASNPVLREMAEKIGFTSTLRPQWAVMPYAAFTGDPTGKSEDPFSIFYIEASSTFKIMTLTKGSPASVLSEIESDDTIPNLEMVALQMAWNVLSLVSEDLTWDSHALLSFVTQHRTKLLRSYVMYTKNPLAAGLLFGIPETARSLIEQALQQAKAEKETGISAQKWKRDLEDRVASEFLRDSHSISMSPLQQEGQSEIIQGIQQALCMARMSQEPRWLHDYLVGAFLLLWQEYPMQREECRLLQGAE